MPTCTKCGASVEGKFCSSCGAPAAEAPPSGGTPVAPTDTPLADNVAGTLCYVLGFITGILFLVLEPYNRSKKVRFHAFQSIFLSVVWLAVWFVVRVVFAVLALATGGLALVLTPLLSLIALAFFVLWLFLLWKTYQDQKIVLPVIGPLAEKQA